MMKHVFSSSLADGRGQACLDAGAALSCRMRPDPRFRRGERRILAQAMPKEDSHGGNSRSLENPDALRVGELLVIEFSGVERSSPRHEERIKTGWTHHPAEYRRG